MAAATKRVISKPVTKTVIDLVDEEVYTLELNKDEALLIQGMANAARWQRYAGNVYSTLADDIYDALLGVTGDNSSQAKVGIVGSIKFGPMRDQRA